MGEVVAVRTKYKINSSHEDNQEIREWNMQGKKSEFNKVYGAVDCM